MPPTVLVTGVDGGHDNLRMLGERGAVLLGSLRGIDGDRLQLADDAEPILAAADRMYDEFTHAVAEHARRLGVDVGNPEPQAARREPIVPVSTLSLSEAGVATVLWCTGFDFDYDWLHAACFDATGAPAALSARASTSRRAPDSAGKSPTR